MADIPTLLRSFAPLPQDAVERLLHGITPEPVEVRGCFGYPSFSKGAYSFANMEMPDGVILRWDWLAGEIVMLFSDAPTPSIYQLIHRLRSGKAPARNELIAIGKTFGAGAVVHVRDVRFERSPENMSIVLVVVFKVAEWLPATSAPTTPAAQSTTGKETGKGEWKGERWVEVDPIIALCEQQRLENTRVASRLKNAVAEWDEPRVWRGAISAVLDHCNGRRLPRDFKVAWQFIFSQQIVQNYVSDRKVFGPVLAKAQAFMRLAERGSARQEIVFAAINGYERATAESNAPPSPSSHPSPLATLPPTSP